MVQWLSWAILSHGILDVDLKLFWLFYYIWRFSNVMQTYRILGIIIIFILF